MLPCSHLIFTYHCTLSTSNIVKYKRKLKEEHLLKYKREEQEISSVVISQICVPQNIHGGYSPEASVRLDEMLTEKYL